MKIIFVLKNKDSKEDVESFRKDIIQQLDRMAGVALSNSQSQKTIKEARYYEGKWQAYRYIQQFLADLAIESND